MLIADILHSCSDEGIATAAVTSIGGTFASEMRAEAARAQLTLGALAASFVRGFANDATERDWRDLKAAMRGSDVPVLSGLATIVATMKARGAPVETRPHLRPLPGMPAAAAAACRLA